MSIISTSALLVEMNLSVWTAQRVDRRASTQVTNDAHAVADAGQFKKNLMAGTSLRKDIADYAALCRTWHSGRTLPWSDKGVRLLPMSMFLAYKAEANARKSYFDSLVDKFLIQYPTLVNDAHRHMGTLFDASEYPTPDEVRDKFAFKLIFSPVPEAGDFRLDAPAAELNELKAQWTDAADARVKEAMNVAWGKLHAMLKTMSDKLVESDEETKRVYHATFVSNAQEMCELLSHLNITKDPALEEARKHLENAMRGIDIDDIRNSTDVRAAIKKKVDEAISKFSAW